MRGFGGTGLAEYEIKVGAGGFELEVCRSDQGSALELGGDCE